MGKSIPVSLPNGRAWSKKGDASNYYREMLNKYAVGARVHEPSDHSDLAALVAVYDADVPVGETTKSGCGIDYFEKGIDYDHPGKTSCFFVVRKDGSRIDFSIGRALDVAARRNS
jgi:hypothetical protein